MLKLASGLAFTALALCACASQEHGRHPGGPGGGFPGGQLQESAIARPVSLLFVGFDTNDDEVTTSEELAAGLKAEFARADKDKDGFISGFEMVDWATLMMGDKEAQPDYRTMNADLGQSVSPDEFTRAFQHEFTKMDHDGDGKLTRAELLMQAPRMGGFDGPGGGGCQMRRGGPPGGGGGRRGPG